VLIENKIAEIGQHFREIRLLLYFLILIWVHSVTQAGLKLVILLPQPPEYCAGIIGVPGLQSCTSAPRETQNLSEANLTHPLPQTLRHQWDRAGVASVGPCL
jgi:ACR3 family arsenite efflux pump ArsB